MFKNICEKCKKIINKEPKWYTDIKVGDKLESWYCCNWEGGDGSWKKRDKIIEILKIDGQLVYWRFNLNAEVQISLIRIFKTEHTLHT